jgi:glycyl-tRNA synthetase beta chain
VFNLLDARGVISVTERQSYILRVRELAKACGEAWLATDGRRGRVMPDLLLELFSEEIPARMQAKAADDLKKMVTDRLVDAGSSTRRARVRDAAPADAVRAGRAGAPAGPEGRAQGPARRRARRRDRGLPQGGGLSSISEADPEGPEEGRLLHRAHREAGPSGDRRDRRILQVVLRTFPWPKSMRWGAQSRNPAASNGCAAACDRRDLRAGDRGARDRARRDRRHQRRQHDLRPSLPGAGRDQVRHFDDYVASLEKAKVVLDPARRREIILNDAKNLRFAQGFELVEDEALLNEVAGLVEWPVVLMGTFEESFLKIPDEVIRATIRNNQKCFVVRDPKTGALANRFILTANTEAADGGKAIIAGNERVIRARLSDAKFFYETDLKIKLEERLPKFKDIIFHEKLGTQANALSGLRDWPASCAAGRRGRREGEDRRAARQDRSADRSGRRIPRSAGHDGEILRAGAGRGRSVAAAIEEHYKPAGRTTACRPIRCRSRSRSPTRSIRWSASGRSTRSRREQGPVCAARGGARVIRIVLDNALRLKLLRSSMRIEESCDRQRFALFFFDRLKVQLRDQGARHDLVDAVLRSTAKVQTTCCSSSAASTR